MAARRDPTADVGARGRPPSVLRGGPGAVGVTVEATEQRDDGSWRIELCVVSGTTRQAGNPAPFEALRREFDIADAPVRVAFVPTSTKVRDYRPLPQEVPFTHAPAELGVDHVEETDARRQLTDLTDGGADT